MSFLLIRNDSTYYPQGSTHVKYCLTLLFSPTLTVELCLPLQHLLTNTHHLPHGHRSTPRHRGWPSQVVAQMHRLIQKGPRTLIATVIDTSFCQDGIRLVHDPTGCGQRLWCACGTVVPNMRILVRQMGPAATNRGYVFDGMAPALSSRVSLT